MQITTDTPRNLTSGRIEVKIAQLHGHSTSPGLMGEVIWLECVSCVSAASLLELRVCRPLLSLAAGYVR